MKICTCENILLYGNHIPSPFPPPTLRLHLDWLDSDALDIMHYYPVCTELISFWVVDVIVQQCEHAMEWMS